MDSYGSWKSRDHATGALLYGVKATEGDGMRSSWQFVRTYGNGPYVVNVVL